MFSSVTPCTSILRLFWLFRCCVWCRAVHLQNWFCLVVDELYWMQLVSVADGHAAFASLLVRFVCFFWEHAAWDCFCFVFEWVSGLHPVCQCVLWVSSQSLQHEPVFVSRSMISNEILESLHACISSVSWCSCGCRSAGICQAQVCCVAMRHVLIFERFLHLVGWIAVGLMLLNLLRLLSSSDTIGHKCKQWFLTDPSFAHLKSAQAPCFGEECIHALWKGDGLHEQIERLQQSHIMSGRLPGRVSCASGILVSSGKARHRGGELPKGMPFNLQHVVRDADSSRLVKHCESTGSSTANNKKKSFAEHSGISATGSFLMSLTSVVQCFGHFWTRQQIAEDRSCSMNGSSFVLATVYLFFYAWVEGNLFRYISPSHAPTGDILGVISFCFGTVP